MHARKPRGDLHRAHGIGRFHRTHGNHHLAVKDARRFASDVGEVHRHIGPLLNVTHGDASLNQGLLKGERTAKHERHQIIAPDARDVFGFVDQVAINPDPIARDVITDVNVASQRR